MACCGSNHRGVLVRLAPLLVGISLLGGCSSDGDESTPTPAPVSFADLEADILVPTCGFSSCHGNGAGGLTLAEGEAYSVLVGVPSTQQPSVPRVSAGDPDASYLLQKLEAAEGITGDPMPPGGSLDDDEIESFRRWIAAGAPNN